MWSWVDHLGLVLLDAGIAALVLLAVVAGVMISTRQPVRRVYLARAGLVALLALVPLVELDLLPRLSVVDLTWESGLWPGLTGRTKWAPEVQAPQAQSGVAASSLLRSSLTRTLTIIYLAGVTCGVAWLTLGYLGLIWLARHTCEPSPAARALYRALTIESGLHPPRLRVSTRVRRPVLLGFPHPLVLIPPELDPDAPGLTAAARDQLRLGLLHELAHAEAGDTAASLVAQLAGVVWFVLPPVWWLAAQLRLDQEFLADRRAAIRFGALEEYASALLEFASTRQNPATPLASPARTLHDTLAGDQSALFQRVLMLVRCPYPVEDAPPAGWFWGLAGSMFLATLAASSLSIHPTDTPPSAVATTPGSDFRLGQLDLPARPPSPRGRAPVFELPLRIPERFDLTLEVWADPATLTQTRVVGLTLGAPTGQPSPPDAPESWHVVHVRRDRAGITLEIDLQPDFAPRAPRLVTSWLTVEPAPDREGHFRSLHLTW